MASTAFESSRNVTLVGAVFSVAVSVGGERLTASGAAEIIHSFFLYLLRVRVPPALAAFPGTENPRLLFFGLHERSAAFPTDGRSGIRGRGILRSGQIVSAAIAFYGVLRDAERFTDFCIGRAFGAEFCYGAFLFIGHEDSSNPRISILMVKQKKEAGIEGMQIKKPVSIPKNTHRQSYAQI